MELYVFCVLRSVGLLRLSIYNTLICLEPLSLSHGYMSFSYSLLELYSSFLHLKIVIYLEFIWRLDCEIKGQI